MNTRPPAPRKKAQPEFPRLTGEPVETLIVIMATLVFCGMSLFVLVTELVPSVWFAHASATSWQKTKGHVTESEWEYGHHLLTGKPKPRRARIVYRYSVDSREFESRQVELLESYSLADYGEHLRRYPQGSQVTVYYQPGNPANSALQPGMRWSTLAVVVFVFACLCGISYYTARGSWIAFQRYRSRSSTLPPVQP